MSELNSSGWLRAKKEVILNNNNNNTDNENDFEDALDVALNYQTIEKKPRKNIKIKALY